MWILVITYWFVTLPGSDGSVSNPYIVTQQFSSRKQCTDVKSTIDETFRDVDQINKRLQEQYASGTGPNSKIVYKTNCVGP
jgi:hypothetical protein